MTALSMTLLASATVLSRVCPRLSVAGNLRLLQSRRTVPAACITQPAESRPALPDGFVVVDKPTNMTSFDVVFKVRSTLEKHFKAHGHTFGRRSRLKVGHGGTLDPLATGFLVVGVGGGTKRLQKYLTGAKGYTATAQLGVETDTQDSEGTQLSAAPFAHVTRKALEEAAARLTGPIMQRPPIYSALRKDGKRLHELARAGKIQPDEVEARPVTVYELTVGAFDAQAGTFDLTVQCSGGTYIRSLIVEIGRAVESAAHMTALRRTRHGPFCSLEEAHVLRTAPPLRALASAGVVPVTGEELREPTRLLEAVEEANRALEASGALEVAEEMAGADEPGVALEMADSDDEPGGQTSKRAT